MLKKLNIGNKITLILLVSVCLAITIISVVSYKITSDANQSLYTETLEVLSALKSKEISSIFSDLKVSIHSIRNQPKVKKSIQDINRLFSKSAQDSLYVFSSDSSFIETHLHLDAYMEPILNLNKYKSIMILDTAGIILYNTEKEEIKHQVGTLLHQFADKQASQLTSSDNISYSMPYISSGHVYMDAIASIHHDDILIGYVVTEFRMDKIYQVTNDTTGLGKTGELLIAQQIKQDTSWTILNPKRNQPKHAFKFEELKFTEQNYALERAVKGGSGQGFTTDYQARPVLAKWTYIPEAQWGMIIKIDEQEIVQHANHLAQVFIYICLFIMLLVLLVGSVFSRRLIRPLLSLQSTLQIVAQGVLPKNVPIYTQDEIGEMAATTQDLISSLKHNADFAKQIGQGQYDITFEPISNKDVLGNALVSMRDSIKNAELRDTERNWIVSGLADMGQMLRLHNSLESLGDDMLTYIVKQIQAIQGAFYTVKDELNQEPMLVMSASYAYGKKKYLKKQFRFAQGLVGQCAIEQDTIIRTEIPSDYFTITSGILGDQKPKCLLLIPLVTDGKTFGVLEFAAFKLFSQAQVKFVQEISLIIARTIFSIKVNVRTASLLEESNSQKETLRQRGQEMKSTQFELQKANAKLEIQITKVQQAQKRMQVILENASEVIVIYEETGTIRYVSPSVESILGYLPKELIGKTDTNVEQESKHKMYYAFQQLLNYPDRSIIIEYEYRLKNQSTIWLEATGRNLLSDPAINGIVLNARDITERRRAEQEARMRGQMQALSENSPDLITRLDPSGKIFYINPVIEQLTGLAPDQLIQERFDTLSFLKETKSFWENLLDEVKEKQFMVRKEVHLNTILGNRTMKVNAIPELDTDQNMESVLIVANDITDQKQTQSELLSINKKIHESINYAKRIQNAILPDIQILNNVFPDSFIFYKPRDVVSGDFPWFIQTPTYTFISVVDCTGHGVPGALISLIGYFLLNDIVNTQEIYETGLMLDALDQNVEKTLRQDMDAKTRDGMDIAICRIDKQQENMQYSGAHRPLYLVQQNELLQIKGDRFPVGGGQYKNRTNFKTHNLTLSSGDAAYIFSDGLPDQFGGEREKKFSPRRIRKIVMEHHQKSMKDIGVIFDMEFDAWIGNRRQIDDVLIIGIKF